MTKTQNHEKESVAAPVSTPVLPSITRAIVDDQANNFHDFVVSQVSLEPAEVKGANLLYVSMQLAEGADIIEYEFYNDKNIKIKEGFSGLTSFLISDLPSQTPLTLQIRECRLEKNPLCGEWFPQEPITLKFPVQEKEQVKSQSLMSQEIEIENKVQELGRQIYLELKDYVENMKLCGLPLKQPFPQELLDKSLKMGPGGIAAWLLVENNNCEVIDIVQSDGAKLRELSCNEESKPKASEGVLTEKKFDELRKAFVIGLGSAVFAGAVRKVGQGSVDVYGKVVKKYGIHPTAAKGVGIIAVGSLIAYFVAVNPDFSNYAVEALVEGISSSMFLAEGTGEVKEDHPYCREAQNNIASVINHYREGRHLRVSLEKIITALKAEG